MSEWRKTKLGDVISIKGGFAYKAEYIGEGTAILLGMGCVSFKDKFLFSGGRLYAGDCPDSYIIKPGNIVLATRQQSDNMPILGLPALVPKEYEGKKVIVGANLYRVENTSEINNTFLYWLLKTPFYQSHILACAKGTTVRMITKDAVETFEFQCPPKTERDAIAEVLSSLDEKIDLLHRNNYTIEQMSGIIFRQWFTEEPEASLTRGVLSDLVEINPKQPLKKRSSASYLEMSNLQETLYHPINWYERPFSSGAKFINGDTLLARITPCLENGKTAYIDFLNDGEVGWGSTEYIVMRTKGLLHPFFSYLLARQNEFRNFAIGSMVGTSGRQRADVNNIAAYGIPIPSKKTTDRFNEYIIPMLNKMKHNNMHVRTLINLRDSLLPKLMNREVSFD